jgi:hypothetical protein
VKYRRWTLGLAIEVAPDRCRCGHDRDEGRHGPTSECFGGCPDESAHHPFRRRLIPVKITKEVVW